MSIETKIDALTGALEANTVAMTKVVEIWGKLLGQAASVKAKMESGEITGITAAGVPVVEPTAPKAQKAAKAEKPAATPTAAATATETPAPTQATDPAATETATASPSEVEHDGSAHSVTLADVQAALKSKVSDYRADVVATLKKYGVSKSSELKPEQYQLALDDLNAIGQDVE